MWPGRDGKEEEISWKFENFHLRREFIQNYGRDCFWCILIRLGIQTRIAKIPLSSRVFVQFTAFHASPGWCAAEILCSLLCERNAKHQEKNWKLWRIFPARFFLFLERDSEKAPRKNFLIYFEPERGKEFHSFLRSIKLIRVGARRKAENHQKEFVEGEHTKLAELGEIMLCGTLCADKPKIFCWWSRFLWMEAPSASQSLYGQQNRTPKVNLFLFERKLVLNSCLRAVESLLPGTHLEASLGIEFACRRPTNTIKCEQFREQQPVRQQKQDWNNFSCRPVSWPCSVLKKSISFAFNLVNKQQYLSKHASLKIFSKYLPEQIHEILILGCCRKAKIIV